MRNRTALLALAVLVASLRGADLPIPVLPEGMGVNIHFTRGHPRDLELIAAAGFRFVRMDLHWASTERTAGRYDWSEYDELLAGLEARRLRALLILDYSNPLYERDITVTDHATGRDKRETAAPHSAESVAAFARWAAAAAGHFRRRRVVWEIWNEPNLSFWAPRPDAGQYATLALAAARSIRDSDPDATIVGPASSEFPWAFLETVFRAGLLEYLDGVTVHPYRAGPPESAAADFRRLRALIERLAPPARKHIPVISGEWGYATPREHGVSLDTQAAYAVRQQLVNVADGVPLSIWYDWKNDGLDPEDKEHNFGTLFANLDAKPAYRALRTLAHELEGYRIARRLEAGHDSAWVLLCVNPAGDQKLVAWSQDVPREAVVRLPSLHAQPFAMRDGWGASKTRAEACRLVLSLDALPQYLHLDPPLPELAAAAAWRIESPRPTLLEAGKPDNLVLPLTLTNPFPKPIHVRLRLSGVDKNPVVIERGLAAGESAQGEFRTTVYLRSGADIAARIDADFEQADGAGTPVLIGQSSERLAFVSSDPVTFDVAPVEAGLRVNVSSATQPLRGESLHFASTGLAMPKAADPSGRTPLVIPREALASLELRDGSGHVVARPPATRFVAIEPASLTTAIDGDQTVPATAAVTPTSSAPDAPPFRQGWKLDYAFGAGWRFVSCAPQQRIDGKLERPPIPGRPDELGLWIRGNVSGNALRIRLVDATGQIFQVTGPNVDWTDWRWVRFDVAALESQPHWGGANDGTVHGALALDSLLLVDSTRAENKGTLWFAGPHWIYRK